MRNVALGGAGLAQVLENQVALQVEELEDAKEGSGSVEELIRGPRGWSVLRVQVEIHREEPEEAIVVEAVFEHI